MKLFLSITVAIILTYVLGAVTFFVQPNEAWWALPTVFLLAIALMAACGWALYEFLRT